MPHTYSQNVVHVVFSTKDRQKLIPPDFQARLWSYSTGICKRIGVFVHAVGGTEDHIHLLLQVPPTLPVAKAVLAIKTNSSRWAHEKNNGFSWQEGYGAFSVSASNLAAAILYIRNQAAHHRKMDFETEFRVLLKKCGIVFDEKYGCG